MIKLLILLIAGESPRWQERGLAAFQIRGDASCPSAAQIARRLARLYPDLDVRGWRLELSIVAGASDFQMRVYDPSKSLVAERRFIGLSDCNQRAEAVAATLAVWLGELAAQPLPAPLYPATTSEHPPAEALGPAAVAVDRSASPAVPTRRWQLELGTAALGSLDDTGAGAAGIDLSAWARPVARRWGLQAHLEWEAPRTMALGPGFADWQRLTLGAGAHALLERGRIGFELEADLLGGVSITRGRDLTAPHLDAGLGPGVFVGARFFADPLQAWRGWLSVGGALWPVRQQVGLFSGTATAPSVLATLPQVELLLALGGSWLD